LAQTLDSTTSTAPEFSGSKDQQQLAEQLWHVFKIQGRFFGERAPIRMNVDQLVAFMEQRQPGGKDWAKRITAALSANPAVFGREDLDDGVVFTTTKVGQAPESIVLSVRAQTLTRRFATPEPKRETRVQPQRKSAGYVELHDATVDTTPAPAYDPDSWQAAVAASIREAEAAGVPPEQAPVVAPAAIAAPVAEELDDDAPVIETGEAHAVDVSAVADDELADAVRNALSRELSVARWGDYWMSEERVQRFSRGDLRRIEDLLRDQSEPVADRDIVQDVLGVRSNAAGFETAIFAVNYRLSHESREFEYLGTSTAGLWALANQQTIGTPKRKASEIGQDYRFLLDYRATAEPIEAGLVEHVLTFYEYVHGLLPLDANVGSLMPKQGFPDQRAARVTFESPQTHETVVAELRFPTSNRGGFVAGLENFYATNLVPGAVLTIEQTDQPTHFLLEYFQASGTDRKLLQLDERKSRYSFRPTTFYCATQAEMLLTESRFPKLADAKPLDERSKRRPEQVVATTFERIGENIGLTDAPRYQASFADLLAAANIERPISAELLRDILTSGTYQEFSVDDAEEDAFQYEPGTSS
jgi:hypothetical protein